jgi:hypothetical protein
MAQFIKEFHKEKLLEDLQRRGHISIILEHGIRIRFKMYFLYFISSFKIPHIPTLLFQASLKHPTDL